MQYSLNAISLESLVIEYYAQISKRGLKHLNLCNTKLKLTWIAISNISTQFNINVVFHAISQVYCLFYVIVLLFLLPSAKWTQQFLFSIFYSLMQLHHETRRLAIEYQWIHLQNVSVWLHASIRFWKKRKRREKRYHSIFNRKNAFKLIVSFLFAFHFAKSIQTHKYQCCAEMTVSWKLLSRNYLR